MMNTCSGQDRELAVRPATQAGRFYEADAQVLGAEVDSLLGGTCAHGAGGQGRNQTTCAGYLLQTHRHTLRSPVS